MRLPRELTTITPVSRLLAYTVFIVTPFIGFFYGIQYEEMITPLALSDSLTTFTTTSTIDSSPTQTVKSDFLIEDSAIQNQKRFTSARLGISFLFLNKYANKPVATKIIGNRIYIYTQDMKPEEGQSVEVFVKNPSQSLVETIEEQFLANHPKDFCFVEQDEYHQNKYPANFETVELGFKKGSTPETLYENLEKCHPYTIGGGDSFFLMDKNHPDKFAHFSIGQYSIFAEEKFNADGSPDYGVKSWQDTFSFF